MKTVIKLIAALILMPLVIISYACAWVYTGLYVGWNFGIYHSTEIFSNKKQIDVSKSQDSLDQIIKAQAAAFEKLSKM